MSYSSKALLRTFFAPTDLQKVKLLMHADTHNILNAKCPILKKILKCSKISTGTPNIKFRSLFIRMLHSKKSNDGETCGEINKGVLIIKLANAPMTYAGVRK